MKKIKILVLCMAVIGFVACNKTASEEKEFQYQASKAKLPDQKLDSTALLVADTLIYDVLLKNPNKADDWAEQCLKNIDIRTLADNLFESVYNGKLQAVTFSTGEPMSIDQVKAFEAKPECNRDLISKAQFEEKWFFDPNTAQLVKKVTAVMLAYEINATENRYRAGIKIVFP